MIRSPAILDGQPAFDPALPFARPTIGSADDVLAILADSFETGMLTNGPRVRDLEEQVAERFGVDHCVAVASCTLGLALVVQALDPSGPVLIPSFTFSASAHAASWNRAEIEFADCQSDTWTLGADDIRTAPSVIMGVHISGVPCDVQALTSEAERIGADLVFDAAHGAGSRTLVDGSLTPLGGFGRAEVFSLTPTKVLNSAEGGLITTNDAALADHLRIAREYGNPGNYDTQFPGLNARLSEMHAALALESLRYLDEWVDHRNEVAKRYQDVLGTLPGIQFQTVPDGAVSSYKDFTILVDADEFGVTRDAVATGLGHDGIATRKYYSPPVHRQTAYKHVQTPQLHTTDHLASQVISLPMWSHLPIEHIDRVGEVFAAIHSNGEQVQAAAGGVPSQGAPR